ncbi:helix-turn-helix domain-containing protein [Enterocloster asparagiformis]|uniref:DNA-binding family protein n=2 Tax=Enterocloster asparagiformis TaxID=333367 RepID=C0D323_9FIRM|nr:helix-turn-helix transcriptional regulator [Enterocloster asparagiformis]EEG54271.1 DNA-binding family protein [[Clostridium] asparagiforme DSM 15981]RGX21694.1 XRE family transcriptional regulator [Enterocloster asparagiformis]UWO74753.1 helix-turn-helix domain-containing protein [[Clostridium] asparagiforme DSM 15981]
MDSSYIAKRITQLRLKKNIAEHRMSLDLGHSRSYMQGISSGRAFPSMTEFLAICEYLGVTPRDFFEEENENPRLVSQITAKSKGLPDDDLSLVLSLIERLSK